MMQVLVLRFDYKSSLVLENLQRQAATASRTSERQLPPHMTLQTFQHTNPSNLERIMEKISPILTDVTFRFSSLGFFKQNGTFFILPTVSKALLDAHHEIHAVTRGVPRQSNQYEPGNWVPHATIITDVAAPFWGPMFARLSMEFEPFTAKAAAVECWTIKDSQVKTDWSRFLS